MGTEVPGMKLILSNAFHYFFPPLHGRDGPVRVVFYCIVNQS